LHLAAIRKVKETMKIISSGFQIRINNSKIADRYKSKPMRSVFSVLFFFLISTVISFAQNGEKRIFLKSGKSTFTIKSERCNYIRLTFYQEGDSLKYYTTSIKGQLLTASPIEISLTPNYSKSIKVRNDCFNQNSETTYPLNAGPITFKVNEINVLSYQTNAASSCLVIGGILTLIGSVTTLIIAPLLSIDYKTGNFNSQHYYTIAAVGLGMGVVSIPLFIFSKEKKFFLKQPKGLKGKTWQIIK
jgi:hypothetical protein